MENLYTAKVIKVGTSKAICIPSQILKALELERGDYVVFAVYKGGEFVARKLSPAELQAIKPKQILLD